MAKEKIKTLRGKRLVTGDPNLVTMNEIHVKDTSEGVEITERDKNGKLVNISMPSGGGESDGGEETIRYCNVLSVFGMEILIHMAAIVKCTVDGTTKFYSNADDNAMSNYDILATGIIISDSYEQLKSIGKGFEEVYASMVNDGLLQTITKEEFYSLN